MQCDVEAPKALGNMLASVAVLYACAIHLHAAAVHACAVHAARVCACAVLCMLVLCMLLLCMLLCTLNQSLVVIMQMHDTDASQH